MRQDWEPEDLIEVWTLLEDDMRRVRNKSGATRLGFALLLKFFEVEARFPQSAKEVPASAVEYVAQQVKVPAGAWAEYDWQSKAIQRHRGEIRAAYGFRANTEEDQDRLAEPGADEAATAPDTAGHAVPRAADGDHRLARGPVHPARTEDQHSGGAPSVSAAGTAVPGAGLLVDVGDAVGVVISCLRLPQAAVDPVAALDQQRGRRGGDE